MGNCSLKINTLDEDFSVRVQGAGETVHLLPSLKKLHFFAVSPEQNPNFFPTKSRCGMNRPATASLHSATPKKNVPCFSDLAVVKFFLKNERTFFFGALPSRSRAGGGTMRTKFWQSYFLGKGFARTSAHLFLNSEVANGKGGVWGGIFHLPPFLFWGNSGRTSPYYIIL